MNAIIVPIDFSELTDHILEEAVYYGKSTHNKIYLLHVASLDLGFIIGDIGFQYLPELEEAGMKEEIKELTKYEKQLQEQGVDVEIIVKQGVPSEIILQEAEEKQANLIVMGSHGRGLFMEALLGSVSKDVIKKSPIPVLIVPPSKVQQKK